ncbi:ABC transporter permease [Chitinophaga niabensis]|uniref:ABC-2 type transport system permease protein n=1 Tax=Chitinophaga niabensis TaxID=536979 RepID=A0A1N6DNK2_9BACT|nr:ABC transporter permease [Chitinophaga niabensis]SIN72330.1 ABC-2 type transport system permease protein [Chitinophaga niabensis]
MIKALLQITLREWKRILTRPEHNLVLLVIPPLLFFFYAFIYNKQQAEDLPVAIWDEDHSPVSRQITFLLEQTASIHITEQVNSQAELEQRMQEQKIIGAIHFPKGMERDIKSRHPVSVTIYTNAASLVPGKLIYKDASTVIITAGSGVNLQKFMKTGMPEEKAMALIMPVSLTVYPLYNPTYNYQHYLVPGLITVALQMMIIMVAVLIINQEWKEGTMETLRITAHNSAGLIITGKAIAHLTTSWVNFVLMTGVIFPIFSLSHPGTLWQLFLLFNLLALACIGIGMMASVIASDVMLALDAGLFYTSPAFVFSGFTFPRWGMPWYDQYYASLMPYTPFLDGFFKLYFMELPLRYAMPEIIRLLLFIGFTFFIAVFFLQVRLNKSVRYVITP